MIRQHCLLIAANHDCRPRAAQQLQVRKVLFGANIEFWHRHGGDDENRVAAVLLDLVGYRHEILGPTFVELVWFAISHLGKSGRSPFADNNIRVNHNNLRFDAELDQQVRDALRLRAHQLGARDSGKHLQRTTLLELRMSHQQIRLQKRQASVITTG